MKVIKREPVERALFYLTRDNYRAAKHWLLIALELKEAIPERKSKYKWSHPVKIEKMKAVKTAPHP